MSVRADPVLTGMMRRRNSSVRRRSSLLPSNMGMGSSASLGYAPSLSSISGQVWGSGSEAHSGSISSQGERRLSQYQRRNATDAPLPTFKMEVVAEEEDDEED